MINVAKFGGHLLKLFRASPCMKTISESLSISLSIFLPPYCSRRGSSSISVCMDSKLLAFLTFALLTLLTILAINAMIPHYCSDCPLSASLSGL